VVVFPWVGIDVEMMNPESLPGAGMARFGEGPFRCLRLRTRVGTGPSTD